MGESFLGLGGLIQLYNRLAIALHSLDCAQQLVEIKNIIGLAHVLYVLAELKEKTFSLNCPN